MQFHLFNHRIVELFLAVAPQLLLSEILIQQKYDLDRLCGIGMKTYEESAGEKTQHEHNQHDENRFGTPLEQNVDNRHQTCQQEVSADPVEP